MFIIPFTIIFTCVLGIGSCGSTNGNDLSLNNAIFAVDLYKQVKTNPKVDNIFFSPISISTAMAMTHLAARKNTKAELEDVMQFKTGDAIHGSFKTLNSALYSNANNYTLKSANRLFAADHYSFRKQFINSAALYYGAGLKKMDFFNAPEPSRVEINNWVARHTENKIRDLLHKGTITSLTAMVLVNAIYFQGLWKSKFDPVSTRPMPFFPAKGPSVNVQMMYQSGSFRYGSSMSSQILQLPYNGDVSMYVILPNAKQGLANVEAQFTAQKLNNAIESMYKTKVKVWLPKFKLEKMKLDLKKIFKSMGMKDIFDMSRADLTGLGGRPGDMFVSDILHQAFVEVDEKGTKAAASTAVVVSFKSASVSRDKLFRADHPFMFLIRHDPTKTILFLGRFQNPA